MLEFNNQYYYKLQTPNWVLIPSIFKIRPFFFFLVFLRKERIHNTWFLINSHQKKKKERKKKKEFHYNLSLFNFSLWTWICVGSKSFPIHSYCPYFFFPHFFIFSLPISSPDFLVKYREKEKKRLSKICRIIWRSISFSGVCFFSHDYWFMGIGELIWSGIHQILLFSADSYYYYYFPFLRWAFWHLILSISCFLSFAYHHLTLHFISRNLSPWKVPHFLSSF